MVSRDDLTCHNCNTTGLDERSRTADQFSTDRKQLIYATTCPECGERVDPAHIRQLFVIFIGPLVVLWMLDQIPTADTWPPWRLLR